MAMHTASPNASELAESSANPAPWTNANVSATFCPWQAAGWETPAAQDAAKRESIHQGLNDYKRAEISNLDTAGSPSLAKVARTIIRRINYPKAACGKQSLYKKDTRRNGIAFKAGEATKGERDKSLSAKSRRILSQDDECEVFQTCALVMTARGILHSDSLSREDWKVLFRETRAQLGIDRMRSGEITAATDDPIFALSESVRSGYDAEAVALARVKLAKRLRYWHACISKACEVSPSRKRKSNRKLHLATLRTIAAGNLVFSGMTQLEMQAASKAKTALLAAVTMGEAAFDAEAESELAESDARRLRGIEAAMFAHLVA